MRSKNICKFSVPAISDNLSVSCFIYESNEDIMTSSNKAKDHRVALIVKGDGKFKIEGEEFDYCSGSLVFIFKDETFSVSPQSETEYMYICFSGTRAEELFRRFGLSDINRMFDGFDGLIPLWQESLSRADNRSIDLAAESILLYTFSRFSAGDTSHGTLLSKIVEITEEHFRDPDLSINTVAEMLSYNPKYVSHIFKEKMKRGYSEYLRTLRIKYAVSLIEHGIDSVKNVALLSGFTDPLYFSTVFKKVTGVSPKEYKIRLNKAENNFDEEKKDESI